jgi:hypothetical protein
LSNTPTGGVDAVQETNLAYFERNPADVERLASDSIELSTRLNFARWLTLEPFYAAGRAVLLATRLKESRGSRMK